MRKDVSRIALPSNMVRVIDYIIRKVAFLGYTSRPEFLNSLVRRYLHEKKQHEVKLATPLKSTN